jgi:hypothetical protein
MVEGGPFVTTDGNCRSLADLSDEFELAELSAACDDFSRSRLSALEFDPPGIVSGLLLRITTLEERQETLEHSLTNKRTKVSALENRTGILEGSIFVLSADRE